MSAYISDLGDGRCITQGFYHLLVGVSLLLRRLNDSKSVNAETILTANKVKNLSNNHVKSLLLRSLLKLIVHLRLNQKTHAGLVRFPVAEPAGEGGRFVALLDKDDRRVLVAA